MTDYEWWIVDKQTLMCSECGAWMSKHVIKEGARYHVTWWDTHGAHCSEKNCEKNHKCEVQHETK